MFSPMCSAIGTFLSSPKLKDASHSPYIYAPLEKILSLKNGNHT